MGHVAFPERPVDKVEKLSGQLANKDGKISIANMLILFYLFCDGKTEENLVHIFNLFDEDGNKVITIEELLEMMSVFIDWGGQGPQDRPGHRHGRDVPAWRQRQEPEA